MADAAETINVFKGLPTNERTDRIDLLGTLPVAEHEVVDASSKDVEPTMLNCREIGVDTTGIVKFDNIDHQGTTHTQVRTLTAGQPVKYRNVVKVYKEYVAQSDSTGKVYTDAGASVIGLKLYR